MTTPPEFIANLEKSPITIEKWNAQEVKVTFDDLIVKFMNEELKFKEDSFLLKLKVAVYFVLNVIGGLTGAYAHFYKPFSAARPLILLGSSLYLAGLGLFTALLQFNYIRPTIYRGNKNGPVWIESSFAYPQGIYSIRGESAGKKFTLQVPVGSWITEAGEIVPEAVYSLLKRELKF